MAVALDCTPSDEQEWRMCEVIAEQLGCSPIVVAYMRGHRFAQEFSVTDPAHAQEQYETAEEGSIDEFCAHKAWVQASYAQLKASTTATDLLTAFEGSPYAVHMGSLNPCPDDVTGLVAYAAKKLDTFMR